LKESYGEDLADHTSLASCGNCRNVIAETLTERSIGGLLSSEIISYRVPITWSDGWMSPPQKKAPLRLRMEERDQWGQVPYVVCNRIIRPHFPFILQLCFWWAIKMNFMKWVVT